MIKFLSSVKLGKVLRSIVLRVDKSEISCNFSIEVMPQLAALFSQLGNYRQVSVPQNLIAQLRPYQERGFSWLVQNIEINFGSILADDMGLGKTLQVIAAILYCKNAGFFVSSR